MKNNNDTIKSVEADNNTIDSLVKVINQSYYMLQKEIQTAKQLSKYLYNYLITELGKPKTYYKRILDK